MHLRRTATLLGAICLVVLVGACNRGGGSVTTGSPGEAGRLTGRVTAGPTCPVVRASPGSACADRPLPGAILVVTDGEGRRVTSVTSGSDGGFHVELPAGHYRLMPQPVAGVLGTAAPIDVVVRAAAATAEPVSVVYDTGIR